MILRLLSIIRLAGAHIGDLWHVSFYRDVSNEYGQHSIILKKIATTSLNTSRVDSRYLEVQGTF